MRFGNESQCHVATAAVLYFRGVGISRRKKFAFAILQLCHTSSGNDNNAIWLEQLISNSASTLFVEPNKYLQVTMLIVMK